MNPSADELAAILAALVVRMPPRAAEPPAVAPWQRAARIDASIDALRHAPATKPWRMRGLR